MASLGRVLVVDDEPQIAAVLRDALLELGYEVCVGGTGRDARSMLSEWRPAVALLDLNLPDVPGESVIKSLRQAAPTVPIVIISGTSDAERARAVLQTGAFDYLAKPFDIFVLERVVAAAVIEHGRRSSGESPAVQ